MRRPRLPNMIGACAILSGLLALPPHMVAQTLPALDSLPSGVTMEMVERGRTIFHGDGLCVDCHGPDVPEARSSTGTAMPRLPSRPAVSRCRRVAGRTFRPRTSNA